MIVKHGPDVSVISSATLGAKSLSFRAKGLLAYLLSRPPDFTVTVRGLARVSKEGRSAVASALHELRDQHILTPARGGGWVVSDPIEEPW